MEIIRGYTFYNFENIGPKEMKNLAEKLEDTLSRFSIYNDGVIFYNEKGITIKESKVGPKSKNRIQIIKEESIAEASLDGPSHMNESFDAVAETVKKYLSEINSNKVCS